MSTALAPNRLSPSLRQTLERIAGVPAPSPYTRYQSDPEAYASDVLGVRWWSKQVEIANALLTHKRVLVKAGNGPGKSFLAGGLINWFYDAFAQGICLSTAPTAQQVQDVLWKEVRRQRKGRPGLQPKAARMEDAPDHYATGYTAQNAESFQGRHLEPLFLIFDEATGIDPEFYIAGEGMQPTYWLLLLNPTDTSSHAYTLDGAEGWHTVTLNSFEHPNIVAEMRGEPAPYPQASLRLDWLRARVKEWCDPIAAADTSSTDIEFEGDWYRPGALFESRVLGRWASQGTYSIWSESLWDAAQREQPLIGGETIIGCDVARFGDDYTSIVVRRGNSVLHHETHNGWSTVQTAGRLKQLAQEWKHADEPLFEVTINIDDDGVGGGVVDHAGQYRFVPVSAGSRALETEKHPNRRSELWFTVAERAREGRLDLSRLTDTAKALLRRQLMSPTWKLDSEGRRVAEPKADTKKRLGRSPDDADALNLAFAGQAQNTFVMDNYAGFGRRR